VKGNSLQAAGIEIVRVVEGALGTLALIGVLTVITIQLARWWKRRPRADGEPRTPALAVFADSENTNPVTFGGGAWSARVRARRDTVTYGYLAVAEEYHSEDTGGRWCTLTVTLPGRVPLVAVDNRVAAGRSGVPLETTHRGTLDDPPFDATYMVGAAEEQAATRVLSPAARDVLLRAPVQRLLLRETQLQLRTFDGVTLDDHVIASLDGIAARFLAATPSFVTASRAPAASNGASPGSGEPLRPGFYGPDG
jgi:hypothetical protein